MMGANRKDLMPSGEFPQRHIQVKPFAVDKYPVTNADFKFRVFKNLLFFRYKKFVITHKKNYFN